MIKKDTIVLLISTAVGIGIITILSFFIVWIGFPVEDPKDSFKDSLEFSSSIFGGLTTFGAAIIAAHLFNDWKVQHNKQVINNFGLEVYELFYGFENDLSIYHQYLEELQSLIESYDYDVNSATLYADNNYIYISNITNTMNKLKLSFSSLYSKFQAYSIVSGTLKDDAIRYNDYLFTFNDINMFDDDIFYIQKNLNTWCEKYNNTLELSNKIRSLEIEKLLVSLKAE